MRAKFGGRCPVCQLRYPAGSNIARYGDKWGHPTCVEADTERQRILAGATFAGQRESDYRRKIRRD